MSFTLTERDRARLTGVHPDLVHVVELAASLAHDRFTVLEGMRTVERQRELVRKGASTTMRSRHLTGHAVDIAPLLDTDGDGDVEVSWHWPHYRPLAELVKGAARELDVPIEWGGGWKSFPDGPHWQLPWKYYP